MNVGMISVRKHGPKTYLKIQNSAHTHLEVDAEHPADRDAVYPTLCLSLQFFLSCSGAVAK